MELDKRSISISLNFPYGGFDLLYKEVKDMDPNNLKKIQVDIDLSELPFLRPNTTLAIAECLIALKKKNVTFSIIPPKASLPKQYLKDIGLEDFCHTNWISALPYNSKPRESFLPIRKIVANQMVDYIEEVKKYYLRLFPNKDLSCLGVLISEIINNIYDHSEDEAYCFLQYMPKDKEILFVANDHGTGIVQKVKEYKRKKGTLDLELGKFDLDLSLLKWATKLGNSTHSKPNNAGKGLDTIITIVTNTEGSSLQIYSNNCHFQISENGIKRWGKNPVKEYIGTSIELVLKVTNLPDKEEEDFDFEF